MGACISTTEGGIHALKNPHSSCAYMVAQRLCCGDVGRKDVALIGREWILYVIIRVFRKIWMRIVNNGVIMLNNRFLWQQI